jgi:hypothetical protein
MPADAAPITSRKNAARLSSRRCSGRPGRPMGSTATSGGPAARQRHAGQRQAEQAAQREQHPRHEGQPVQASTPARPTPSQPRPMASIQSMSSQSPGA